MTTVSSTELRTRFAAALSDLYGTEVPAYTTLLEVSTEVNRRVLARRGETAERLGSIERVTAERHGAIRVGPPARWRRWPGSSGRSGCGRWAPRVLDIDDLYASMQARGTEMIDRIQGPPAWDGPDVLLRQTSFRALAEPRAFVEPDGTVTENTLRVRFGEVESRGPLRPPVHEIAGGRPRRARPAVMTAEGTRLTIESVLVRRGNGSAQDGVSSPP